LEQEEGALRREKRRGDCEGGLFKGENAVVFSVEGRTDSSSPMLLAMEENGRERKKKETKSNPGWGGEKGKRKARRNFYGGEKRALLTRDTEGETKKGSADVLARTVEKRKKRKKTSLSTKEERAETTSPSAAE